MSIALARYLERHIESDLPEVPTGAGPWQHVLVIPAYQESPALLDKLAACLCDPLPTLVILVLNRPNNATDEQCNTPLREAAIPPGEKARAGASVKKLNATTDLYLFDIETSRGPSPAAAGVGLARKLGCDLALRWQHSGAIKSRWLCSSDADATLPGDYFQRLADAPEKSVVAVYPFRHIDGPCSRTNHATAVYELRLHHYVLGLEYAESPYAYHTLGSALAIDGNCYAQVRGFPRRAAGEDFYLLNKAAKTGPIARLTGSCIELESRASHRVPFGTGPAVSKIIASGKCAAQPLFYHPQSFEALRLCLQAIPQLCALPSEQLRDVLIEHALPDALAQASSDALHAMGLGDAISHCRRQGKSAEQFMRQFHQWFDGFRTLKFIHALRDSQHWPNQSIESLSSLPLSLWPTNSADPLDVASLRRCVENHWGWKRA